MSSQPYDPYPGGNPGGASRTPKSTADVQAQIDEATGRMQHNVDQLAQRGENLNALQDKTDNLAVSAQGFKQGANRVRKRMWWSDMKWRMILIGGIVILLLVIIVPIVVHKT